MESLVQGRLKQISVKVKRNEKTFIIIKGTNLPKKKNSTPFLKTFYYCGATLGLDSHPHELIG